MSIAEGEKKKKIKVMDSPGKAKSRMWLGCQAFEGSTEELGKRGAETDNGWAKGGAVLSQ